jgi:hypothetical protein
MGKAQIVSGSCPWCSEPIEFKDNGQQTSFTCPHCGRSIELAAGRHAYLMQVREKTCYKTFRSLAEWLGALTVILSIWGAAVLSRSQPLLAGCIAVIGVCGAVVQRYFLIILDDIADFAIEKNSRQPGND